MKHSINHHVAVHTTRPELLFKQVKTFFDNYAIFHKSTGNKVKFHVFVDNNSDKNFRREIIKIKKNIIRYEKNFSIKLWTKKDQKKHLPSEYLDYFYDKHIKKLGGIRNIHNISEYILNIYEAEKGDIIHRIDDDIYPLDLTVLKNKIIIDNKMDFFGERITLLRKKDVYLLGSAYAGDSPSPIAEIYHTLRIVNNFLEFLKKQDVNVSWFSDSRKICESSADKVYDPYHLLDTFPLRRTATYGETLSRIANLLNNLSLGRGRLIFAPSDFFNKKNWITYREYFPNGALSHKEEHIVNPSFFKGAPDIVTHTMESRCGNKLHGAPAVLHLKTARSSLINMKNFNEKYNFPLTANILKYLGKTGYMGSKSSLEDFVKYGKFQVRKITEYCENIQKNLIFLLKTYPKNKSLLKIKKITYQIKNKKTLLYCQFDKKKSTKEIKSVIESYVEYINKWKQILKERKTNK